MFSAHLLLDQAVLLLAIDDLSTSKYRYDKMFFDILAEKRCCRDRRQTRKKGEGLGSSLIKVSHENSTLDQRRFSELRIKVSFKISNYL